MNNQSEVDNFLKAIAGVLIRSFILGIVVLMVWFLFLVLIDDLAYSIHSTWFDMTKQQFDLLWYGGMGLIKIFLFFFFLFPYIGIRMVLAKK